MLAAPLLLAAAAAPLKQVALVDIPGHPGFDEIALAHAMILVSHPGEGTVDLFDTQKRRIVGHIRNMSSPRGVAVDNAANLVYIANSGARNIVVVSTADWQVQRTIPLPAAPDALLLADGQLYATFPDAGSIAVLDPSQNARPVQQVPVEGRPSAFAYDASRHQLYLTLQDRRRILVFDPALKPVTVFTLNAFEPTGIVFSPVHHRLYVAVRYAVLALDPDDGREVSRSPVAGGIDQLTLDASSSSLLGIANGSVFVLPASATLGPAAEMPIEVKGHTLACDPATGFIYLPGAREGHSKLLILKRLTRPSSPS